MPFDRHRYPADWKAISLAIRARAGGRCEGPLSSSWMVPVTNTGRCLAVQGEPHPVTGSKVVLTVAHVHDPNPMNCAPENLAATCQRCHLNHDRAHHVAKRKANRRAGRAVADLFAT